MKRKLLPRILILILIAATSSFISKAQTDLAESSTRVDEETIFLPVIYRIDYQSKILEDFEAERRFNWWSPDPQTFLYGETDQRAQSGKRSFKVDFHKSSPYQFIGADPISSELADFRGAQFLEVWVYGQVSLLLKIEDQNFKQVEVGVLDAADPQGWNLLRFELNGIADQIDLSRVKLFFFPAPGDASASGTFFLDNLVLRWPSQLHVATNPFLEELAAATWNYLSSSWSTVNHLPWSWRSETISGGDYANPTEIGLYALSWLAAYDLQRDWSPSWDETEGEVQAVLDQLRAWQSGSQVFQPNRPNAYQHSVFYQWYWIAWNPPVVGGGSGDHLVPSVDNAWLAACLITIREYAQAHNHTEIAKKADDILADMDFDLWYHEDTHLFSWGGNENPRAGGLADLYSNENRIINFVARALGHLTRDEFLRSLEALASDPGTYMDITVEKVSWDGSFFTYAAPALFIREMDTEYGRNTILPAAQAQIAYAQDQGYAAWGLSDGFDIGEGGYVQQGAPPVAMYGSPETRPGLVAPHASGLALITPLSSQAAANLQAISESFPCAYEEEYGFRDSVLTNSNSPEYGQCSQRFSALAQEWLFLALVNYQSDFIWEYFYRDSGVRNAHSEMFESYQVFLPLIK
jgi:hypothetical protein